MFAVELWSGYEGRHGELTVLKMIELPFIPFNGLVLLLNVGAVHISETEIAWNHAGECFIVHAEELDDNDHRFESIEQWEQLFANDGWVFPEMIKIDDEYSLIPPLKHKST